MKKANNKKIGIFSTIPSNAFVMHKLWSSDPDKIKFWFDSLQQIVLT